MFGKDVNMGPRHGQKVRTVEHTVLGANIEEHVIHWGDSN